MGCVYLPHDGSHQDRNGRTARDDLMAAGCQRVKTVDRTPHLWDSINDVRDIFTRFWIEEERCAVETRVGTLPDGTDWTLPSGLDCLDLYSKKERTDGIPGEEPDHNAYSHGADALRTFVEAFKLGMLDGTSPTATASRRNNPSPRITLRGPGPGSYPMGMFAKQRRPTIRR
jgi:hypothetical protein